MAPRVLILATQNRDKVREMSRLCADLPVRVVSAADLPEAPDVVEDGDTLEANALKKARETAAACGGMCLADDTGLEVDALGGAPGVYSARYAGEDVSYEDNWRKLLRELDGVPEARRTARFRTVMALVDPRDGTEFTVEGALEGRILSSPSGEGGFGYDPVFLVPELDRTLAEMDLAEENTSSHRGRAGVGMAQRLLSTPKAPTRPIPAICQDPLRACADRGPRSHGGARLRQPPHHP